MEYSTSRVGPEYRPDGRPIHYPTQAEIDALLRHSARSALLPRLRLLHDWTSKLLAYGLLGSVVVSLCVLIGAWLVALVRALLRVLS